MANNLGAVEVEQGNLVVGLVELGYGNDLVPDEQTFVVVQQLVGQGRRASGLDNGSEGVLELVAVDTLQKTTADIENLAVVRGRGGRWLWCRGRHGL